MSTTNGMPVVFNDEQDTGLLGSLFPQGMRGEQSSGGNNFPQFPIGVEFTTLSPKDIGNKYYGNNPVYEQNGVKVYADEGIAFEKELEEVKIYGNRFYKEFKDFTFVLFASKNGALLLNQYKECVVSGNEIALFLEIDDPTNFLGSVMQIKVGTGIDKIKLPIAEMLDFMRTKRVNLESKDIIKLIKGKYQSKESILSWIGEMFTKIIGGITSFVLTSAGTLNQAFISAFDELLIEENRWNTEAEGYNAFFIPDAVRDLLNSTDNDDKIIEAIVSSIITKFDVIEKTVDYSIGLLKPILPSKIYAGVKEKIKKVFLEIDGFLEHVKGVSFLDLLKTAAEVANAHLCGFINGIVEFFKGFFEIIGMILNLANAQADYSKDPFLYNSLLAEMFENLIEMIIGFDFKKFIANAFVYPLNLLVKTIKFVKSINVDVTSLDINLSKIGYLCGYIKGLIVSIIVDAFLTGGVKAVEDILKALGTFLKNPKGVLKDAMKTAGRKTAAAVETVIDFMATMASKVKKGATKLFEDFEKFVDDIFKWIEDLFNSSKTINAGSGGSLKYITVLSNKMLAQEQKMSCAAACMRQLAKDHGIDLTEKAIRKIAGTTEEFGTFVDDIGPSLRKIFTNNEIHFGHANMPQLSSKEIAEILSKNDSWIAIVKPANGMEHAIIIDKIIDKKVYIRDPWPIDGISKTANGVEAIIDINDFITSWERVGQYFARIK